MRPALLLALALAVPAAWAAPKKRDATPAPAAAAVAAASAPDERARTAAFAEVESELASGSKPRAADALVALVDDPSRAAFHAEAYARLGELLADLDLPYSALCAYAKAFELADDTSVALVGIHVPRAIELADKVGDLGILQEPFSRNLGLARTEDVRGRMAYLAAREAFRTESYGMASGLLKMVKEGDPVYPEARLLEGVILNQQGRADDALVPLEAAAKAGGSRSVDFRDLVALNTARSFYGAKNFPRAIQGYGNVSRSSTFWPQAQFERAWSHFRVDDYSGSLGVLMTLQTPFFEDWYFPEADLLRVYSAFLMCKFPAANEELERFKARYAPVVAQLADVEGRSAEDVFEVARAYLTKGDAGGLPIMVLRPYDGEERFEGSVAAVSSVEDELKRMKGASSNPFTERARDWLKDRRAALITTEGTRIRDRIAEQHDELKGMLADTEIFGLDILRMQAQAYERAANAGGKMEAAARVVKREEKVRKGWREWPYEGEMWADELGYYRVDAVPECPASMSKGK